MVGYVTDVSADSESTPQAALWQGPRPDIAMADSTHLQLCRVDALRFHGYMQMAAAASASLGFLAIYLNKERLGKSHLTSQHGQVLDHLPGTVAQLECLSWGSPGGGACLLKPWFSIIIISSPGRALHTQRRPAALSKCGLVNPGSPRFCLTWMVPLQLAAAGVPCAREHTGIAGPGSVQLPSLQYYHQVPAGLAGSDKEDTPPGRVT